MENFEEIRQTAKASNENVEKELKEEFKKDSKKGSFEIAKYLTNKYYAKTIGEEKSEIYIYQNGLDVSGKKVLILCSAIL